MTPSRAPESGARKARVLVLGSGGREHALAWALDQSPSVEQVWVYPGNGVTRSLFGVLPGGERDLAALAPGRGFAQIAEWALTAEVDLVVVGPDGALADGVSDILRAAGLRVFGPDRAGAELEASKLFAKDVMRAAKVPTAAFRVLEARGNESDAELDRLLTTPNGATGGVLKLDGLALGKGVVVCDDRTELRKGVRTLVALARGSNAGTLPAENAAPLRLLLEDRLVGEELSWFAFCDATGVHSLGGARDHKRLRDDDQGPNTGGMGALSPVPGYDERTWGERLEREVFEPVRTELLRRGITYRGVIFAGLMVQPNGSGASYGVLEFNARFGDPETQVIMPRLQQGPGRATGDVSATCDFYETLLACAEDRLRDISKSPRSPVRLDPSLASVGVVAAARGYPESPEKGQELFLDPGLEFARPNTEAEELKGPGELLFAAGVSERARGHWESSGGRVLAGVGVDQTVARARVRAYAVTQKVKFSGMFVRKDIARVRTPIAILASGRGSNFEAIARAISDGRLHARISGVFSDRPDAPALETARRMGLVTQVISLDRVGLPRALAAIDGSGAQWVVLAGFMRILPQTFIDHFSRPFPRIVNIHPSLLPRYKGLNAYRQAFEAGEKVAGVSVHLVEPELDSGPLCAQESFSIEGCRSAAEVEARGLAVEHRLYAETLEWLLGEEFEWDQRRIKRVHSR